jgi:hypothetical protein
MSIVCIVYEYSVCCTIPAVLPIRRQSPRAVALAVENGLLGEHCGAAARICVVPPRAIVGRVILGQVSPWCTHSLTNLSLFDLDRYLGRLGSLVLTLCSDEACRAHHTTAPAIRLSFGSADGLCTRSSMSTVV